MLDALMKDLRIRKIRGEVKMSRVIEENTNSIILDEGHGYKIKATRKDIGSFVVVAIEWEHPNYGFFADAMLWINSLHLEGWEPFPIVNWSEVYENLDEFLADYPEFKDLYSERTFFDVITWGKNR